MTLAGKQVGKEVLEARVGLPRGFASGGCYGILAGVKILSSRNQLPAPSLLRKTKKLYNNGVKIFFPPL